MKIYGCQIDIAWEDKDENFRRVLALLKKHQLSPGSLVVLPEMFATGFSMNTGAIAENDDGSTYGFLKSLASENGVFVIGGRVRVGLRGQLLNEAICFDPSGKQVASYTKLHLFTPGDESRHYAPGAAVTLFRWGEMKVAVFICYDLRFPEIFRIAAQRGANVLVVIANWPGKRHLHWTTLLRARAIENQAYTVGINRCGIDPQQDCYGGSLVVNPMGAMVAEAGGAETVLSANLDLSAMNELRQNFSVLKDVRTRFVLMKRTKPTVSSRLDWQSTAGKQSEQ